MRAPVSAAHRAPASSAAGRSVPPPDTRASRRASNAVRAASDASAAIHPGGRSAAAGRSVNGSTARRSPGRSASRTFRTARLRCASAPTDLADGAVLPDVSTATRSARPGPSGRGTRSPARSSSSAVPLQPPARQDRGPPRIRSRPPPATNRTRSPRALLADAGPGHGAEHDAVRGLERPLLVRRHVPHAKRQTGIRPGPDGEVAPDEHGRLVRRHAEGQAVVRRIVVGRTAPGHELHGVGGARPRGVGVAEHQLLLGADLERQHPLLDHPALAEQAHPGGAGGGRRHRDQDLRPSLGGPAGAGREQRHVGRGHGGRGDPDPAARGPHGARHGGRIPVRGPTVGEDPKVRPAATGRPPDAFPPSDGIPRVRVRARPCVPPPPARTPPRRPTTGRSGRPRAGSSGPAPDARRHVHHDDRRGGRKRTGAGGGPTGPLE